MSNDKIFEGSVLKEALQAAAAGTGIAEPDLDYEIIEQGRRGLFGIGARSVRIRVMPPLGTLVEDEAPRRRSGTRTRGCGSKRESPVEAPAPRAPRRSARAKTQPAGRSRPASGPPASPEDTATVQSTVQRMLDLLQFEIQVKAEPAEGGVRIVLEGPDHDMLRGKDVEFFPALQFLLNRMSRRAWPSAGRVMLDQDENREDRDQELTELTHEVARQVSRTGKVKQLHEMNAYERRLVHLAVREYKNLGSRSEGSGYLKRVRIFKQKSGGKGRPPAAGQSR